MNHEQSNPRDVHIALTIHNGLGQAILESLINEPSHELTLENLATQRLVGEHKIRNTVHYLSEADLLTESGDGTRVTLSERGVQLISIILHMYNLADESVPPQVV